MDKNKLNKYNSIINTLQQNDRNATFDEILRDMEYNITEAINLLKSCLRRIISEEGLEGEELRFYQEQLMLSENI